MANFADIHSQSAQDAKIATVVDTLASPVSVPTKIDTPRTDALEVLTKAQGQQLAAMQLSMAASAAFIDKFRSARVTGPNTLVGAVNDVVVTFSKPFADANYTVSATIFQCGALSGVLSSFSIVAQTAASVTVRVKNVGILAMTPVVHVIAIHD